MLLLERHGPSSLANGGCGLAQLKKAFQLVFQHHNAGENAKAAAQVVILAEQRTGMHFLQPAQRINSKRNHIKQTSRDGVSSGKLACHVAVFTGSLTISREEATSFAAFVGINVRTTVTAKTPLLIVGDQDCLSWQDTQKAPSTERSNSVSLKDSLLRLCRRRTS